VSAQAEPEGYRAAVDEAIAEFTARRFEEARTLFARAHGIFPNARTLRGLGLAEFELRDYVACVQHLDAALKSEVRPLEAALRDQTEELRQRAAGFVARLTITSRPAAARLMVDGAPADSPKEPLLLSYGMHSLELSAPGYEPERRSVVMAGGDERTLNVEFQRPLNVSLQRDVGRLEARWYENPWLWVAAGAVVVAAAATTVAIVSNSSRSTEPALGGTSGVVIPGL
jgi:hypothetical protein